MMRLPRSDGGLLSTTNIYTNHPSIPNTATAMLKTYDPANRDAKNPITADAGIMYPTPDFISFDIVETLVNFGLLLDKLAFFNSKIKIFQKRFIYHYFRVFISNM